MQSGKTQPRLRIKNILWIAVLGAWGLIPYPARGQDPQFSESEVKGRLIQSLEKMERLFRRFHGEGTLSEYTDVGRHALNLKSAEQAKAEKRQPPTPDYREQNMRFSTLTEKSRFTFTWNDDLRKFRRDFQLQTKFDNQNFEYVPIEPQPSEAIAGVYCRGPARTFKLRYFAGKDQPELVSLETSTEPGSERMALSQSPDSFVFAPVRFGGYSLVTLIKDKSFEIRNIKPEERDGVHLLRIDFKFDPKAIFAQVAGSRKPPKDLRKLLSSGSLLVDPERDFLVREVTEIRELNPAGYPKRISYTTAPDGLPIPKQVEYLVGVTRYAFTFDKFEYGPTPESEFTLAAYGLPEPGGSDAMARKRWLAMPYMLGLAALVCLIAAVGFRYWGKRISSHAIDLV